MLDHAKIGHAADWIVGGSQGPSLLFSMLLRVEGTLSMLQQEFKSRVQQWGLNLRKMQMDMNNETQGLPSRGRGALGCGQWCDRPAPCHCGQRPCRACLHTISLSMGMMYARFGPTCTHSHT